MKLQNNISSLAPMGNKAGRSVQKKNWSITENFERSTKVNLVIRVAVEKPARKISGRPLVNSTSLSALQ